jgi:serine/threonine-protein kinase HipA
MRRGRVSLDGEYAGVIEETEAGSRFLYDPAWLARADALPISLTLPLRDAPYDSKGLHPFFENLLPEGWLLELSTAKLKISKDDVFGLLLATCADCVGAVEVRPFDENHP